MTKEERTGEACNNQPLNDEMCVRTHSSKPISEHPKNFKDSPEKDKEPKKEKPKEKKKSSGKRREDNVD